MKHIAEIFKALFDFLALIILGGWMSDHEVPPFNDDWEDRE